MVDSVGASADIRANSQAFIYRLKMAEFTIKDTTKAFLLENEGSIFYLETGNVDVTKVLLAQILITLKKEADVVKENFDEIFTNFSDINTMPLKQNEDWQKSFPDLLICELDKGEQINEQSYIIESWLNIVKEKSKKIIFIVKDSRHLEIISMKNIGIAKIFNLTLPDISKKGEAIKYAANYEKENTEANLLDKQNVNDESARALDEDIGFEVKKESTGKILLPDFWQEVDSIKYEVTCESKNTEANLDKQNINDESKSARALDENIDFDAKKESNGKTLLPDDFWKEDKSIEYELTSESKITEANLYKQNINDESKSARALDEDMQFNVKEKSSFHGEATADNADLESLLQSLGVEELDDVNQCGNTQLHLAARDGKTRIVESLLAQGAKKDIQNNDGSTALHFAAQNGDRAMVHILLEHGFNVNATDHDQWTPLHSACYKPNNIHLVEILLKCGADIERREMSGRTALHVASVMGRDEVVNLLLKHGASINAQDNDGNSPLHMAIKYNNRKVVLLLLQQDANLSIKNKHQRNVFDQARFHHLT